MNFLGIDTSSKSLTVVAAKGEETAVKEAGSAMQHSVLLFPAIEEALGALSLTVRDCDFFACVTGPGSFTGIRIGISAVKGLCLAVGRPALPVTSFEAIAYADKRKVLPLVDAGHDFFYACGFEGGRMTFPPAYLPRERVLRLREEGYLLLSREPLSVETELCIPSKGILAAAREKAPVPPALLEALYLRKSSAEEGR